MRSNVWHFGILCLSIILSFNLYQAPNSFCLIILSPKGTIVTFIIWLQPMHKIKCLTLWHPLSLYYSFIPFLSVCIWPAFLCFQSLGPPVFNWYLASNTTQTFPFGFLVNVISALRIWLVLWLAYAKCLISCYFLSLPLILPLPTESVSICFCSVSMFLPPSPLQPSSD